MLYFDFPRTGKGGGRGGGNSATKLSDAAKAKLHAMDQERKFVKVCSKWDFCLHYGVIRVCAYLRDWIRIASDCIESINSINLYLNLNWLCVHSIHSVFLDSCHGLLRKH